MSGRAPRLARLALPIALLALTGGVAGLLCWARNAERWTVWSADVGVDWALVGSDGRPLAAPGPSGVAGLPIPDGAEVRLTEDTGPFNRLEHVTLQLQPDEPASALDLCVHDDGFNSLRVRLEPGTPPQLEVVDSRGAGASPPVALAADAWTPGRAIVLQLVPQGHVSRLLLDGRDTGIELQPGNGTFSVGARGGPVRLLRLAASGTHSMEYGNFAHFTIQQRWQVASSTQLRRASLSALGWIAGVLLLIGAWLRALCRGRPTRRAWGSSTLLLGGAVAAPACRLLDPGLRGAPAFDLRDLLAPACVLGLVALPFALRRLGQALRQATPRGRLDAGRAIGWALLLSGAVGGVLANQQWQIVQARRVLEHEASALGAPPDFDAPEPLQLDAANALVVPGTWRNLELRADVTLSADSALGVRVRAPDVDGPHGLLLLLSGDDRAPTGFRREDTMVFDPLGTGGARQPTGRVLPLRLVVADRELSAFLGDTPIAQATDDQFPGGSVVLLAEWGTVSVQGLHVTALPATAQPEPAAWPEWRTWIVPALAPALALLLFALLAARLLRLPWRVVLEPAAFAGLPILLSFAGWMQDGLFPAETLRWAGLASVVLLFLVPVLHAPRGAAARACGVLALAVAGVPVSMRVALGNDLVLGDAKANRAHYAIWSGDRLDDDRLYVLHPRFRLKNDWLAHHALRDGEHALAKPAGTRRVLCLGASCTWGYRLPPGQGLEAPARLGELLNASGTGAPVEVLNGSVVGAPSFVLRRFFRDVLVGYDPDVLVLSLYRADAYALAQCDEETYYAAITAHDFSRGALFDLRTLLELRPARARFEDMVLRSADPQAPDAWPDAALAATPTWGLHGALPPPERFAAELNATIALCRQRGIDVVLVKEVLADDPPHLWKDQFYGVLDDVGRQAGVPVVDPRAAMAAAGGRHLFFDAVHPNAAGQAVLARAIEPIVKQVLDARASAAATGR